DGKRRDRRALAQRALHFTFFSDFFDLRFEPLDLPTQDASVDLDLLLPFPFEIGASTCGLPRKVCPESFKPRQLIPASGQFDLQFGFFRLGALGKYLEDELCAIDDRTRKELF